MGDFAECSNTYGAAKRECEATVAFNRGAKLGEDLEANKPSTERDVKDFHDSVASDPYSYKLLKSFYEGMRSKSDEVHLSEKNSQLDVYIDFGVHTKVDSVANGIKQWTGSTELSADQALSNGLQEANNKLHSMNTDLKRRKGQPVDEFNRQVQDRKHERDDFVRVFNEQNVPGVKAELDKRGHVKVVREK